MVPIAMVELDEAHAALGQAARQQTIGGEGAGLLRILAVEIERARGLLGDVGQFRHRSLHAERHLVLRHARVGFGIAELRRRHPVQLAQRVQELAPVVRGEALRVREVQHRVARRSGTSRPDTGWAESPLPHSRS